ncbi:hypothetical protein OG765_01340 [Streptomyces sp. NBC_00555]|uniref:hypothetical protein n=1 Tax=Streptomyces sp. NBC_00555 TaxID=2903662 RepID=UPI002259CB33|nr:hypothetical protein [Streptomyces sp. NBC_00555]MCX5009638.1 hypothetical protein [Streptomyces sp. NBC_00555]
MGRNDPEFISGKNKQNAVKAVVLTDAAGKLLFYERQRKAPSSRRIRVEHGIAHRKSLGPPVGHAYPLAHDPDEA